MTQKDVILSLRIIMSRVFKKFTRIDFSLVTQTLSEDVWSLSLGHVGVKFSEEVLHVTKKTLKRRTHCETADFYALVHQVHKKGNSQETLLICTRTKRQARVKRMLFAQLPEFSLNRIYSLTLLVPSSSLMVLLVKESNKRKKWRCLEWMP